MSTPIPHNAPLVTDGDRAAVEAVLAGQVPANVVNPEVLEQAGFKAKLGRLGSA